MIEAIQEFFSSAFGAIAFTTHHGNSHQAYCGKGEKDFFHNFFVLRFGGKSIIYIASQRLSHASIIEVSTPTYVRVSRRVTGNSLNRRLLPGQPYIQTPHNTVYHLLQVEIKIKWDGLFVIPLHNAMQPFHLSFRKVEPGDTEAFIGGRIKEESR